LRRHSTTWSPEPGPEAFRELVDGSCPESSYPPLNTTWVRSSGRCHPYASLAYIHPTTLENNMMNRIRTRIAAKRTESQLQAAYFWRPGSGG
jgi:hypothetical protein